MPLDKILGTSIANPSESSNVIRVTADSASTVNANAINFMNSSSVSVTVEPGIDGAANVSFRAPVTIGLIIALSGD